MQIWYAVARLSLVEWASLVTAVSTATGALLLWHQGVAARRREGPVVECDVTLGLTRHHFRPTLIIRNRASFGLDVKRARLIKPRGGKIGYGHALNTDLTNKPEISDTVELVEYVPPPGPGPSGPITGITRVDLCVAVPEHWRGEVIEVEVLLCDRDAIERDRTIRVRRSIKNLPPLPEALSRIPRPARPA